MDRYLRCGGASVEDWKSISGIVPLGLDGPISPPSKCEVEQAI